MFRCKFWTCLALFPLLLSGCVEREEVVVIELPQRPETLPAPGLMRLEFLASDNPACLVGDVSCTIIGDSVAECWVPHLMESKVLVPRFTVEGGVAECCGVSIESGVTAIDFSHPTTVTVRTGTTRRDYTVYVHAFTGLPVLWIETDNRDSINSKEKYVRASFRLMEDVVTRSSGDVTAVTGQMRGRGNSTWEMPKKPYRLKLDDKQQLLGEPADRSWVLLANYADKTMLRNAVAFRMGTMLGMDYVPRHHFVDVMLNGHYEGTYQLCEQVEVGEHKVDVGNNGFLLEADFRAAEDPDARTIITDHLYYPVSIKHPTVESGDDNYRYVADFMAKADSVLFSDGFTDLENGWQKYLDINSFADWYVVNELARNNDAVLFASCFMSLRRGGKLHMGPLWDFDIAFGNIDYNWNYEIEGLWVGGNHSQWYQRLLQDPVFVKCVRERIALLHDRRDDIFRAINDDAAYLRRSVEENEHRWHTFYNATWPNYNVWGSYQNELLYLKTWLSKRLDWLYREFILSVSSQTESVF